MFASELCNKLLWSLSTQMGMFSLVFFFLLKTALKSSLQITEATLALKD